MVNEFGKRLKYCRLQNRLSQQDLAERVGVQSAAISKYENGATLPNILTLAGLCQALECSADWLLGLEDTFTKEDRNPFSEKIESLPDNTRQRVQGYMDALTDPALIHSSSASTAVATYSVDMITTLVGDNMRDYRTYGIKVTTEKGTMTFNDISTDKKMVVDLANKIINHKPELEHLSDIIMDAIE